MENDDLMPNDGSYFIPREPTDQVIARKKERAKTLEVKSSLIELVDHFDKRIEFYSSVDAMPDDVKTEPEKFLIMHNSNQLTRDNLINERDYIISLLDSTGQSVM